MVRLPITNGRRDVGRQGPQQILEPCRRERPPRGVDERVNPNSVVRVAVRVVVRLVAVVVRGIRAAGVRAICLLRVRVVVRLVACARINQ